MASRILLADDSITIQKVVNLTFADEGIEVVAVSNGEMAERRLNEIDPDLVLADIFMPGKNGYELCEHIKQSPQFQNVPVVLLVGAFEPFDQNEARRVKADAHLTKPFESRNLVETVRKLIKDSGRPVTAPRSQQSSVEGGYSPAPAAPELKPIAPPPVNIDFSAMSNEWPVANSATGFDAPSDLGFSALSHTSPLTIDLGNAAQTSHSFSIDEQQTPAQNADNDFDDTLVMGSPFAANSASTAPAPEDINISIGEPVEAYDAASEVKAEDDNLSTESISTETSRVGVPSAFGHPMQEVIVDFDKTDDHQQPGHENIVSFDAGSAISSVDETGATVIATVELEEPAQQKVEPSTAEDQSIEAYAPVEVSEPEPESTGFEIAASIDDEEEVSENLSPETLLETDSPLGDVFVDEKGQSESFAEDVYSSAAPLSDSVSDDALDLTPNVAWAEPPADAVAPHLSASYASQPRFEAATPSTFYDSQAVAEATHSAVAVEDMPAAEPAMEAGSSFDVVMAATEDVAWQATENEVASAPPSGNAISDQWAAAEAPFAAIDAETAKLDEHQVESVPTETGFEFKPVTEYAPEPEEIKQAEAVESVASELVASESVASEPVPQSSADLSSVSEALIDQIVRRVIERMSSDVVREIAWEVVPDMVERVVREVAHGSASKKA